MKNGAHPAHMKAEKPIDMYKFSIFYRVKHLLEEGSDI